MILHSLTRQNVEKKIFVFKNVLKKCILRRGRANLDSVLINNYIYIYNHYNIFIRIIVHLNIFFFKKRFVNPKSCITLISHV